MFDHKTKKVETTSQTVKNVMVHQSLSNDQAKLKHQKELQEWTAQRAIQREKASEIQQQFDQSNLARKPSSWGMSLQRQKAIVVSSLQAMSLRNQDELVMQRSAEQVQQLQKYYQTNVQRLAEDGISPILPYEKNSIQRQYDHLNAETKKNAQPALNEQRRSELQQEAEQEIVGTLNRDARHLPFQVRLEWAEDIVKKYEQKGLDGATLRAFLNKKSQELYPQMGQIHQRHDQIKERQDQQKAQQLSSMQRQLEHYALQCQMEEAMTAHQEQNNLSIQERIAARAGQGQALENILSKQVLQQLQEKLNLGLEGICIHTDSEAHVIAKNLGSIAFASGKNIYFQSGKFNPNTKAGFELLVHELSHVKQQLQGQAPPGLDEDAGLEAEAQNIGKTLAEELFPVGDRPELKEEPVSAEKEPQADEPAVIHLKRKPKVAEGQLAETGAVQRKKDPTSQQGKQLSQKDQADDPTLQAESPLDQWRRSGNLVGNPPVKEAPPPNINVRESEEEYNDVRASVVALLQKQKDRAESMKNASRVSDFRFWFAKVYSLVTESALNFASEKAFHYPTYLMRSILYFEKMYEDNLKADQSKQKEAEEHWKEAFKTADQEKEVFDDADMTFKEGLGISALLPFSVMKLNDKKIEYAVTAPIYSLVAQMLAHIRYDLPRAEAWIFDSYYSYGGVSIDDFRIDFFSMSGIFDNSTRKMMSVIKEEFDAAGYDVSKQLTMYMDQQALGDDMMRDFMGANMSVERLDTWSRAEDLLDMDGRGKDPYKYVKGARGKPGKLEGDITRDDLISNTVNASADKEKHPSLYGIKSKGKIRKSIENFVNFIDSSSDGFQDMKKGFQCREVGNGKIENLSWEIRSRLILNIMKGESLDAAVKIPGERAFGGHATTAESAQECVVRILSLTKDMNDLRLVVGACDAYSILRMLDGKEREKVEKIFCDKIYPHMDVLNAVNQCLKWIDKDGADSEEALKVYKSIQKKDKNSAYKILKELKKQGRDVKW